MFAQKLATENTWQEQYVQEAIFEYRRFLYLMAVSPSKLAPSKLIDVVWHLHLTFTKNYWDDLCGQILKQPLHHNPSSGSSGEERELAEAYNLTLAMYRDEFGENPPAKFWPRPGDRGESHEVRMFNPKHYLLLPRKYFPFLLFVGFGLFWLGTRFSFAVAAPFMAIGAACIVCGYAFGPPGVGASTNGSCGGSGCGGGHGGCNGGWSGSCGGICGGGCGGH